MHDRERVVDVEDTIRAKVEEMYRYLAAESASRMNGRSWGKTLITVGWEDGLMTDIKVVEERTIKVGYPPAERHKNKKA